MVLFDLDHTCTDFIETIDHSRAQHIKPQGNSRARAFWSIHSTFSFRQYCTSTPLFITITVTRINYTLRIKHQYDSIVRNSPYFPTIPQTILLLLARPNPTPLHPHPHPHSLPPNHTNTKSLLIVQTTSENASGQKTFLLNTRQETRSPT